jgi:hypothetical protein
MTDQPPPPPENDIADELKNLGQNLKNIVQAAWESDERRKLQEDIQKGLTELQHAVRDFAEGPTGQKLKSEVDDLGQRLRTGEVETKLRTEVLAAIRALNAELTKAAQKSSDAPPSEPPTE